MAANNTPRPLTFQVHFRVPSVGQLSDLSKMVTLASGV